MSALYAFDVDRLGRDAHAEGQRGENGEFVRGIEAANVEGWIGFGVAELLRLGETLLERQLLALHAREDVIAGAVEDAVNALDRIAGEALAQRLDDGNAAGDRRLEGERDPLDPPLFPLRFTAPATDQVEQRHRIGIELLHGMTLNARHHPGDEPT